MGDICSLVLMQREFFPLLLSPWKPQLHCWLSPFPPHAFQINIGAWLPTGCPQRMGAEPWAEGIGARVKPGAWGTVADGMGGMKKDLESSCFPVHPLTKAHPFRSPLPPPKTPPPSEPSVLSQGVP